MAVPSATEALKFGKPGPGRAALLPAHLVPERWRKLVRRASHARGVIERRRFQALRREFYDTLWRDAADYVGAVAVDQPNGLVRIARGGSATFVDRSDLMLDSAIMTRLLANKAMTYPLIAAMGLPMAAYRVFDLGSMGRAEAFLRARRAPVVVKPADGTGGGHGVTTGIETIRALHSAARHAASFNSQLLIEEQLTGASFRLLYLDGEFIDAVRRDSPVVVGDGRSSIRRLVDAENLRRRSQRPISALSPLTIDAESRNTLAASGMTPATVPADGEVVQVKLAVNENAAAQNFNVRARVHEEVIAAGARIVGRLRIGFAGLDVTSRDISAPIEDGETLFNEVNAGPGIHHHYLVANPGERTDVAKLLLERMFEKRIGIIEF